MTENDRILLSNFKATKELYDRSDPLTQTHIARDLGATLANLKYLDNPMLREAAKCARMDFGSPESWPPSNQIVEILRDAEITLLAAISVKE
jgi:hypothetical protein